MSHAEGARAWWPAPGSSVSIPHRLLDAAIAVEPLGLQVPVGVAQFGREYPGQARREPAAVHPAGRESYWSERHDRLS